MQDRSVTEWNPSSTPGHLINRLARALGRIGDARLRALGFGVGQLPVLAALKDGAALSQKALVGLAKIEQSSMAQMLARMERDGLVRRAADPADGRASLYTLTPLARSRLPAAREVLTQGNREALAALDEDEVAQLVGLLKRVLATVEAIDAAPPPAEPPAPAKRTRRR